MTDNVELIFCIQNALSESHAEKSIADVNDTIDDDENEAPVISEA